MHDNCLLDWIVHGFMSPPTQYRLYGRRFLQVKRPNQQYQSTEGKKLQRKTQKRKNTKYTYTYEIVYNKKDTHIKHSKSPSLHYYGVTRGRLPQRAGLPGDGAAAAVPLHDNCVASDLCIQYSSRSATSQSHHIDQQNWSYSVTVNHKQTRHLGLSLQWSPTRNYAHYFVLLGSTRIFYVLVTTSRYIQRPITPLLGYHWN